MAFTWTDIQNSESALSVRTKLNSLGQKMGVESQRIDSLQNDVSALEPQVVNLNTIITIAQNISCPVSQWYDDSVRTYADYPYKADLYIAGTTSDMVPLVNFSASDQESGNYIGAESATNVVTIWAKEKPNAALTIPNVVLLKEANN